MTDQRWGLWVAGLRGPEFKIHTERRLDEYDRRHKLMDPRPVTGKTIAEAILEVPCPPVRDE